MSEQRRNPGSAVFGLNDAPGGEPTPEPTRYAAPAPVAPAPMPPPMPYQYPLQGGSRNTLLTVLVILLAVLAGVNLYLVLTLRSAQQQAVAAADDQQNLLARRLDANDRLYAQLKAQFQVTSERLGMTQQELSRARTLATKIQEQQATAVTALNQAIAQKASADDMNKLQADANAKIGGLSNDLNSNVDTLNKKIGATNDALSGAKGELTGSIARTHDELVALAHKTDRDYFEFSANRNSPQKVGNVTLRLEKTNLKKNNYTVDLLFDDKRTVRKDQAVASPVFFYMQGASSTLELVVTKIDKNSMSGYVSAPKGFFPAAGSVLQARPGS
jgi:hypothetical protein